MTWILTSQIIEAKKKAEEIALEKEAGRLEVRVELLRRVVLNSHELKNLSESMDPNIKNDDILKEIMIESKSIKQLQHVLKKLVGKRGIRRGYKEVKKQVRKAETLNENRISSDGGGRLNDYANKNGTITFTKNAREGENSRLQDEDEY